VGPRYGSNIFHLNPGVSWWTDKVKLQSPFLQQFRKSSVKSYQPIPAPLVAVSHDSNAMQRIKEKLP
jgi:hypothetical protein